MRKRVFRWGESLVEVDESDTQVHVEIEEFVDLDMLRDPRVRDVAFPARPEDDESIQPISNRLPTVPYASVAAALKQSWPGPPFVPAFALAQKAKRIDERIVSAIETWLHEGTAKHMGRRAFLHRLRASLASPATVPQNEAAAVLLAAAHLLGSELPENEILRARVRRRLAPFLKDPGRSTPQGFWSTSELLTRHFRHDRFLAEDLQPEVASVFAEMLTADPTLSEAYRWLLDVPAQLSGALAKVPVLDPNDHKAALFPLSDSMERRLMLDLFGNKPIPAGFRLVSEIVARIRDGRLDTRPAADGAWYAFQQHALAALLDPGSPGVIIGPRYHVELEKLFAALFGLTRETHIKQLEPVAAGGCAIVVSPELTLEPLPEYYRRTADAYARLHAILDAADGESLLRGSAGHGHDPVGDALDYAEALFRGAWATSCAELGRAPEGFAAERAVFRAFRDGIQTDPDLTADMRTVVPLYFDESRETFRVLAILGVEAKKLQATYTARPGVRIDDEPGQRHPSSAVFSPSSYRFCAPLTAEIDMKQLMTREEFRELCDRGKTSEAILAALTDRPRI